MFIRGFLTAMAVLCAVPAAATQCPYWKINGDYVIRQSNSIDVALHLERDGDKLSGQARFYSTSLEHEVAGPLEGYIDGDRLHFRVNWYVLKQETCVKYYGLIPVWCWTDKYDEHGIYEGTISARGEVQGSNYPFERPNSRTSWFLKSELECREIVMIPHGPLAPPKSAPVNGKDLEVRNIPPIVPPQRSPAPRPTDQATRIPPDVSIGAPPTPPVLPPPTGRPGDVIGTADLSATSDRCMDGFVWREARQDDHVCVTPQSRRRVALENRLAASRRNPEGAYGPETCVSGFVWREAYAGDTVCVTPSVRSLVKEENRQAQARYRLWPELIP